MLARSSVIRQASNAVRGNKFSILTFTEEFPYRGVIKATPNVQVVQKSKSDNGIKYISRTRDGGIVNLRVSIAGGSSTESAQQKGAAHFLATAAFAGNKNESGFKLVRHLEGLGAHFNATADREKIVYDISVLNNRVDAAVHYLLESIGSAPAYNHVLEEHREQAQVWYDALHSDSCRLLNELVHEAAFGDSSAFGNSLYASSLDNLKIDDVLKYRVAHFVRENLVIAANGISNDDLKKALDHHAGHVPSGAAQTVPKASFVGGEVKVRNNEEGTTHVAVAFGAPGGEAGKVYDVLHNTLSRRLQKKKICASTFQNKYHQGGFFGIRTNGSAADIDRILRASFDELKAIAQDGSGAQGASVSTGVNAFDALEGRQGPALLIEALLSGVDVNALADTRSVTAKQVSDAAKAVLKSNPAYAVYGITSGSPSHAAVTKLLH